jgi:hypothetical protein
LTAEPFPRQGRRWPPKSRRASPLTLQRTSPRTYPRARGANLLANELRERAARTNSAKERHERAPTSVIANARRVRAPPEPLAKRRRSPENERNQRAQPFRRSRAPAASAPILTQKAPLGRSKALFRRSPTSFPRPSVAALGRTPEPSAPGRSVSPPAFSPARPRAFPPPEIALRPFRETPVQRGLSYPGKNFCRTASAR